MFRLAPLLLLSMLFALPVKAQQIDSAPTTQTVLQPPPSPGELEPTIAAGVSTRILSPIANDSLCPADTECLLGQGVGFGISLERQWASGPAIGFRYDAWFVDTATIYELGVLQALQAYTRYVFSGSDALQPYLFAGIGGVLFGDSFGVSTVGLIGELGPGAELEISPTTSITCSVPLSLLVASEFQTSADDIVRAQSGVDVVIALSLGVRFAQVPPMQ